MYMILYATKPQMKLHESTCTPKHWTVNTQLGSHNFMHTQIVHYTYYVSYSIKIRIKALNLVWRRQRNANTSVGYIQHSNGSYLLLTVLNVKCFGCDKKKQSSIRSMVLIFVNARKNIMLILICDLTLLRIFQSRNEKTGVCSLFGCFIGN